MKRGVSHKKRYNLVGHAFFDCAPGGTYLLPVITGFLRLSPQDRQCGNQCEHDGCKNCGDPDQQVAVRQNLYDGEYGSEDGNDTEESDKINDRFAPRVLCGLLMGGEDIQL